MFPAGFPVGRVIGVRREANQLLAQVRAEPLGRISSSREVMLLDFDPAHPAAPPSAAALAEAAEPVVVPGKTTAAGSATGAARKPGTGAHSSNAAARKPS